MAEETVVFARKASGLVREMSWWDVLLFTIAGPAAGGMTYYTVKMPGIYPGANMTLGFIIGFLVWLAPVLCIAVIASSFPRSGALYVVTARVLHPMFGFIPNWIYVIGGGCGMAAGFIFYQSFIPLASGLQLAGLQSNNHSLVSAGDWLQSPGKRLLVVMIFLVGVWGLELMGLDKLKWVMRSIVYAPLVVTAVALVIFFVTKGQTDGFDHLFGSGTSASIISKANELGIKDAVRPMGSATANALLAVFWAYSALEVTSFVGSEVKSPRKSFMRGLLIGAVAVGILYTLNAFAVNLSYGGEFIRDYAWLYYTDDKGYAALQAILHTKPVQPAIPLYAGMSAHAAWLSLVLAFGYMFWFWNTSLLIWLAGVRGIFAMAFDRMLPIKLASVGKSGNPTWANHFLAVFCLLGGYFGFLDQQGASMAATMVAFMDFGALFFIWPMGLAAMFLPYLRLDLYEKSTFQYKWGGVPVITVIGAITFGVGFWMMCNVGLELTSQWSMILVSGLILLGLIMVAWMYNQNRKEGIDTSLIFTQIPPA
jgi:APA family basic amino acid/polyamine antiporter